ncbi:MAG TPA: ATPase inhibitor subunit zeta [Candidatus Binatia bacterium]|nr:ATPase inhibitor subunit zeta [Candidatus Binatia bacterium]
MNSLNKEILRMVGRNKLVGIWAAEKLGLVGESAKAYSDDLAVGALDVKRSDVLSKIREDFAAAGVVQSDEQIRRVMNQCLLEAGSQEQTTRADATDAALLQIARNLQSD